VKLMKFMHMGAATAGQYVQLSFLDLQRIAQLQ